MKRKRIVFLMSDTGAGHRSAANAIRAAMERRYAGEYVFELVDVYRRYTPFPFKYLPEIYPRWVNWAQHSWGISYHLANATIRSQVAMAIIGRLWASGLRRMLDEHPADVMVCVHALFSRPTMRLLKQMRGRRPPFVTVVTDLVTTHAFWYDPGVDRCLVPTLAAYRRGLSFGLAPAQLRVTGLPVHPRFLDGLQAKDTARRDLGLHATLPIVLLVGGGDGMGPVHRIACELNARRLPMQLVIVAGRNKTLQHRLRAMRWNQPTRVFPFVHTMPELMAAADILVTKAGPSTICEACAAGLPLILSGAVPGQEDGNVAYVLQHQAGVYAPGAQAVADVVAQWLAAGLDYLKKRAAHVRRLGRPGAVWAIAEEIHAQAQQGVACRRLDSLSSQRSPFLRPAPEDGWLL